MNPQFNQTPGLHLPQPTAEMGQASADHAPEPLSAPTPALFNAPPPAAAAQPMQAQPMVALQGSGPQAPTATAQTDDGDDNLLDEEWVNKAREIVERNRMDPFVLSRELGKVKAQYLKARYNKDIKVSEERP